MSASVTSLVIVTVTVADFVASAWLVALTCALAGAGRSAGAVYTPPDVIVPTVVFPPATPFTLQLTLVSVVFVTVAVNIAVFPSTTDPLVGAMVTTIDGGGGGPPELEPPPQPSVHTAAARSAKPAILRDLNFFSPICGRGRIPSAKQAKGQRKRRESRIGTRPLNSLTARLDPTLNQHLAALAECRVASTGSLQVIFSALLSS